MKTYIPDTVRDEILAARDEKDKTALYSLVLGAREAGYSFAEIAEPLHLSRSAVNQWHKSALATDAAPAEIAERPAPPKDPKGTPRKIRPDVPSEQREHLRQTALTARGNTRWSREDSPERTASRELLRLIDLHVNQRSVSVAAFARHAGVTRRAIMQRLEKG